MHLDHQKLVELLVEATGIEKNKVEKQLDELVKEITQAIEEGEAYELEGFGVFSGIGKNIIFIPSTELATEINYKYVGMEAIELSDSPAMDDSPEKAEEEDAISSEEDALEDDPFGGLLDDADEEDLDDSPVSAEPESEEKEEESDLVNELNAQEDPEEEEDILGTEEELVSEKQPGPDKWGIDTYKDDSAENMFSGMLGNKDESEDAPAEEENKEDDKLNELVDAAEEEDSVDEDELSIKLDQAASSEEEQEEDDEDFDDPFKGLIDEEPEEDEGNEEEEVVPVITNISSDATADKEPKEKKREKKKKMTPATQRTASPAVLWVFVTILVLGGGIFGLGYFGVVDIPGIPVQTASNQMTTATPPAATSGVTDREASAENTAPEEESEQVTPATDEEPEESEEEQSPEAIVSETESAGVDPDQPLYGLNGVSVPEANNGYTIVVYSLSKENSAKAQQEKLGNEGFRVLITSQPSPQYGRLWRVSLGQFQSLRDAALAAETLTEPYSENYFITKIQ